MRLQFCPRDPLFPHSYRRYNTLPEESVIYAKPRVSVKFLPFFFFLLPSVLSGSSRDVQCRIAYSIKLTIELGRASAASFEAFCPL